MNINTFLKNFKTLSDAPNAVAKLREIILQFAVNEQSAEKLVDSLKWELFYNERVLLFGQLSRASASTDRTFCPIGAF